MLALLSIAVGYLLGSIPFGYLLVRVTQGADVRESGSGGTGATNVSRRAGKKAGVVVLLLDALKGAAAVIVAQLILAGEANADWLIAASSVACIAGHIFPVWLKFKGGKGVATGLGVFAVLAPSAVALAIGMFVIVVFLTRYVSLGSIIASLALPLIIFVLYKSNIGDFDLSFAPLVCASLGGGLLIVWMHRANIKRLLAGTENKFR